MWPDYLKRHPPEGVMIPASTWRSVLLPAPLGPTTPTDSPCRTVKLTSRSAQNELSPGPLDPPEHRLAKGRLPGEAQVVLDAHVLGADGDRSSRGRLMLTGLRKGGLDRLNSRIARRAGRRRRSRRREQADPVRCGPVVDGSGRNPKMGPWVELVPEVGRARLFSLARPLVRAVECRRQEEPEAHDMAHHVADVPVEDVQARPRRSQGADVNASCTTATSGMSSSHGEACDEKNRTSMQAAGPGQTRSSRRRSGTRRPAGRSWGSRSA